MESWLLTNELYLRLGAFFGVFLIMALWERVRPCRPLNFTRWYRWSNNLALVFLNSLILRILFPVAAVGVALLVEQKGYGLLNLLGVPLFLSTFIAVVTLDMLIYWQHVLFHKIPMLWALHKVHHADLDYDVTTGARFHPLEILLSMLVKMAAIVLLGAPAVAVLVFEILLNASAMFNHSNIQLPRTVDKFVRMFLVTPDMHRVHHSQIQQETDSNYGFSLSCWDRLFSTYTAQPQKGHLGMDIGLSELKEPSLVCSLKGMISLPFRR
ncbi:sterol desaturase family protein [Neptuniibacter marinus]|uniref:sterol desaturase family protein n=2 Tax=Neptuniibacter marinus TaxID=1806670 RepID=UPI00082EFECF|nr:sterol desaturase family protein [Neptuniibacter marinus]